MPFCFISLDPHHSEVFPSFLSVHAQKAGSFVLGHLSDVRDFRCPVLFINIIVSKFVLPRANITSGKNSAFMRRKGVFQELSAEFPYPGAHPMDLQGYLLSKAQC